VTQGPKFALTLKRQREIAEQSARKDSMRKIRPFLWFDDKAEEAAHFYAAIFKNAKIGSVMRYGDAGINARYQRE
jgi:hypothetical protein